MPHEPPINVNDPEHDDPIMAELRQIREGLAAACNYDASTMVRYFEEKRRLTPIEGLIDYLPGREAIARKIVG